MRYKEIIQSENRTVYIADCSMIVVDTILVKELAQKACENKYLFDAILRQFGKGKIYSNTPLRVIDFIFWLKLNQQKHLRKE